MRGQSAGNGGRAAGVSRATGSRGRVVRAAREDERRPRLRQLLHHHDLGHRVDQAAPLLAQLLQRRQPRPVLGVDVGEVVGEQVLPLRGGERRGSRASVSASGLAVAELGDLERRQRPVEDRELVDQAVLEPAVAEPLADRQARRRRRR